MKTLLFLSIIFSLPIISAEKEEKKVKSGLVYTFEIEVPCLGFSSNSYWNEYTILIVKCNSSANVGDLIKCLTEKINRTTSLNLSVNDVRIFYKYKIIPNEVLAKDFYSLLNSDSVKKQYELPKLYIWGKDHAPETRTIETQTV